MVMTETSLVRMKPAAGRTFIPTLILGLTIFALSFFSEKTSSELMQLSYVAAAALLTLFWLLPVSSHFLSYLELTNERVIYRTGFMGLRKKSVELAEVSSIEIVRPRPLRPRVILIRRVDESELEIIGFPKPKLIAAEIERLAKSTLV
jgi:hypothetical protein